MDWRRQITICAFRFERVTMNSWYLPAIPAAVALSVIAYCFSIAY
jgi:hypothetical protein